MDRKPGDVAPAFILGTRKGDPNCGDQETFAPSRYLIFTTNSLLSSKLKLTYIQLFCLY